MRNSVWRVVVALMVAATLVAMLWISYRWLPWQASVKSLGLWTGSAVLAVAEFAVIHSGKTRFRFRMAAQLPLLLHYGVFPVLALQFLLTIGVLVYESLRTRAFVPHYPRIISALDVPFITGLVYQLALALSHSLPASVQEDFLAPFLAMVVFWLLAAASHYVPGRRAVVHPWKPISGWFFFLLFLDGMMAFGALLQLAINGPGTHIAVTLELIAIMGSVSLYSDSSIRRAQLVNLSTLISELSADTEWPKLATHLFEGIRRIVVVDVAALWIVRDSGRLLPGFVHAYAANHEHLADTLRSIEDGELFGMGLVGFAASSRDVVRVCSPTQKLVFEWSEVRRMTPSALAMPVLMDGQTVAVLTLHHETAYSAYARREEELFSVFSKQLGSIFGMLWRYQQTRMKAEVDELTGLYNYRYFDHALHECVAESDSISQPLTLLLIDLDHFKSVNDKYGHLAGNQVLVRLAETLKEMVRNDDIVARYGGEEFTILLPGLTTEEGEIIAERIRSRVEDMTFEIDPTLLDSPRVAFGQVTPKPRAIKLTLSIGVATYPDGADSPLTLIRHADRAMFVGSKQSGRNRVSTYV